MNSVQIEENKNKRKRTEPLSPTNFGTENDSDVKIFDLTQKSHDLNQSVSHTANDYNTLMKRRFVKLNDEVSTTEFMNSDNSQPMITRSIKSD
jgi:hypothetical protein